MLLSGVWASHCSGFSHFRAWALGVGTKQLQLWALERRLRSCGARAKWPHNMWDLPAPGIEPMTPALAGGFLTIRPLVKSLSCLLRNTVLQVLKAVP